MPRLIKFLLATAIITACFLLSSSVIDRFLLSQDLFTEFCSVVATSSGVLLGFGLTAIVWVAQYPVTSLIEIKSSLLNERDKLNAWLEINIWKGLVHYQELSENIHELCEICHSAITEMPVEIKSVGWFDTISNIRRSLRVIVMKNIEQFGLMKKECGGASIPQQSQGDDLLKDMEVIRVNLLTISRELFRIVHRAMLDRLQEVIFEWCKFTMGIMIISIILIPVSSMKFDNIEIITSSYRIYFSIIIVSAFVMLAPIILEIISLYYRSIKFDRKISITYNDAETA